MPIDGEIVSYEWSLPLFDMRRDGVPFRVNEGKRTMARQWYFWNLYKSGRGNLAAYPSPNAPHIREGRKDHAVDFWNDGAVFSWLTAHGLHPVRTVRGESWHIECPVWALLAYAEKHRRPDPLRVLKGKDRRVADRLLYHRREMAREKRSGEGPRFRRQLKWARYWKGRVQRRLKNLASRGHKGSATYNTLEKVLKATDGRL